MRIPILIVARLESSRLREKVLAALNGRPLLAHTVARLKLAAEPDGMVLCTTDAPSDDRLAAVASSLGIQCFRGDTNNVPLRLYAAAQQVGAEFVVVAEADETLIDPDHVDQIVRSYNSAPADYVRITGLPIGTWANGISVAALAKIRAMGDRDFWSRDLTAENGFRVVTMAADPEPPRFDEDIRLTLDYPEDLALLTALFERLPHHDPIRLRDVLQVLEREPELIDLNRHVNARYWKRYADVINHPSVNPAPEIRK